MTDKNQEEIEDIKYDKKYFCPNCNHNFYTKKIKTSKNPKVKTDSDGCSYFKKENPYLYHANVCIHCGYAFVEKPEKEKTEGLSRIGKFNIKEAYTCKLREVPDYCGERTFEEGVKTLKLALWNSTITKQEKSILAGICLRLAWLYRLNENKEEEERFLLNALDLYETIYLEGDSFIENEIKMVSMIAELAIRLDIFDKARKYSGHLLTFVRNAEGSNKACVEKGRDRWQDYRAEKEKELKTQNMSIEEIEKEIDTKLEETKQLLEETGLKGE